MLSVLLACGNGEVHDHDNLREDVLYCEEARTYRTKPDLEVAESQCILSKTCAQLTAIGVCARGSRR